MWDCAFAPEIAGARRRALRRVLRAQTRPTLRDLLVVIGEGMCDLEDTPMAGEVRLGDLVRRDGEGSFVIDVLDGLGLDRADPLASAKRLQLRELDQPLVDLLD